MTSLAQLLAQRATTDATAPAVIEEDATLTWADLDRLSRQMSAHLRTRGVGPGDRVALHCGNSAAFLVAWFGIANLGAIAVTLNIGLVGDGLTYALGQSDPALLVIPEDSAERHAADIAAVRFPLGVLSFVGKSALFAAIAAETPDPVWDGPGSDPLTIIYTSGTTGNPKGVLSSHTAYVESGRRMAEVLDLSRDDRCMVFLPLFHANPQYYAVMSALHTGCSLILRPKFSAGGLFDDARRFGATLFTFVGTVLSMLAARRPEGDTDHRVTRCVGGGTTAELCELMQTRFGIRVHELYGMTETAGWASANRADTYRTGSCGHVRDDLEVAIVDEGDTPVPTGETGEIVIRPRAPFRILLGYWANAEATQKASRNFWFHTGDLGRFDDDGYLYFIGRGNDIIRRGGENISPAALEAAVLDLPGVRDAAAVGVPDAIMGEEIKLCLVTDPGFAADDLPARLRGRVPDFMIPRYLQFLPEIPRTQTEKIRRNLLQANTDGITDLRPPPKP
jgi:crotonobetaine/carnitine-CoA ligase